MRIAIPYILVLLLPMMPVFAAEDSALARADAAYARDDFHRAAIEYQRVLRDEPNHLRALHRVAKYYQSMDRREEAEDYARQLLTHDPGSIDARLILGELREREQDWAGAHGYYKHVLEIEPGFAPAWYAFGNMLRKLGDEAGAESAHAHFERLLNLDAQ